MASIGMIGHSYAYLALERSIDGNSLMLYKGTVTKRELLGEAMEILESSCPYENDTVYLRQELLADKTYRFSWSPDGASYTCIGDPQPLCRATWTGAKLCLWSANKNNVRSEGYGEYEFIHIKDGSGSEEGF